MVSDNNTISVQGYKNPIKYHFDPQVQQEIIKNKSQNCICRGEKYPINEK